MSPLALVTGAGGFIGLHVRDVLLKNGWKMRGYGRGVCPQTLNGAEWIRGDIRDVDTLRRAAENCDTLIHLACLPLASSIEDPVADFQVNALGTINVLHVAHRAKVQRIIYVSTAQVVGSPRRLPVTETANCHPVTPYAISKLCGEILCANYARIFGINAVTLRLFNVYGPTLDGKKRHSVESIFIDRVLHGIPPQIHNPSDARDFIHVTDVARGIFLAADLNLRRTGNVYNIGTGVLTTLPHLAHIIIGLCDAKMEPVMKFEARSPHLRLQADTRRSKKHLGFEAKISLREGLSQLIDLARSTQRREKS